MIFAYISLAIVFAGLSIWIGVARRRGAFVPAPFLFLAIFGSAAQAGCAASQYFLM